MHRGLFPHATFDSLFGSSCLVFGETQPQPLAMASGLERQCAGDTGVVDARSGSLIVLGCDGKLGIGYVTAAPAERRRAVRLRIRGSVSSGIRLQCPV